METFLKTAAAVLGLFALVPLSVWAATGRASRAWEATKGFALVMAIIVIPGVTISAISLLVSRLS